MKRGAYIGFDDLVLDFIRDGKDERILRRSHKWLSGAARHSGSGS